VSVKEPAHPASGPPTAPVVVPQLRFSVESCEPLDYAAVPTLTFGLAIEEADGLPVRSVLLDVQIRIAARGRRYAGPEQDRLLELFGTPDRWATTLRTLPWTRATVVVPPFTANTTVELNVPCTYDLEVTAARYLAALEDGEVPLELMFSGSVFFATPGGMLQTARIAWDTDVSYAMPVSVWRASMDRHFPGAAWLRLGRTSLNRLAAYKARHAFTTWDAAIEALLEQHR
jgi:Family of unknown function (DUF6084)